MRGDTLVPSTERFLDHPNTALQSKVFIFELSSEKETTFRLMATELVDIWGGDFTGRTVEQVFSPEIAQKYLANPRTCGSDQCGVWEKGVFGNIDGREATLELLYLPLAVAPGKAPRLAGLLAKHASSIKPARRRGIIEITNRQWIDIGAGIPSNEPDIFSVH